LALIAVLTSCHTSPILVGDPQVDRIVVEEYAPTIAKPTHTISTPAGLDAVMTVVQSHDKGWSRPMDTFPAPRCTAALYKGATLVAVVFIGKGWIGGRRGNETAPANRIQNISASDMTAVEDVLGVSRGSCSTW
jgi:hypothetical protein